MEKGHERVKVGTRWVHPSAIVCKDESLAQQNAKDESDINVILKRNGLTGVLPTSLVLPEYGDFEMVGDYRSALNLVMQADSAFMRMPAEVRSRFDNDPAKFLEFVHNPENSAEAVKLGIAVAPVEAKPSEAAPKAP